MKRFLSMVLAFVMAFSLTIPSAWAAEVKTTGPSTTTTNGKYDQDGKWTQVDGDSTVTIKDDNGLEARLSKTATPTEVSNEFDITLRVETTMRSNDAATVLVIDVSGSMDRCAECGVDKDSFHDRQCKYSGGFIPEVVKENETRMAAAKAAAISFVDRYKGDQAGIGRYVAIVPFSTDAAVEQNWVDVSTPEGYTQVCEAINGLHVGGGTNLDAGLYAANTLLQDNAVASAGKEQKNVIALTDGVPTYYRGGGHGSEGSKKINSATAATAAELRNNASVYTVCFGAADERCYRNGPQVGYFLEHEIATEIKGGDQYAYSAKDTAELNHAFEEITNHVISGANGKGWVTEDPMGEYITVKNAPSNVTVTEDLKNLQWKLSAPEIKTEDGKAIYIYEITYRVKVDNNAEGFDETKFYPANGRTYLEDPSGKQVEFPVPGVKCELPYFTVIYNKGTNGILQGQDRDGNVIYASLKKGSDTPAAPEVTVDEGYYFTGWQPEVTSKVTGDVTYVAQYAAKKELVVKANSAEVFYNGKEQTVNGLEETVFNIDGKTYTVEGLTASAAGTTVASYVSKVTGTPVVKCEGKDVTGEFIVKTVNGQLVIKKLPVEVQIIGNNLIKEFDGTKQSVEGYTLDIKEPLYKKENIQFGGTAVAEGTNVGNYPMGLSKEQFINTNDNFAVTFSVNDGHLQITPVDTVVVTITGHKSTQMYDGTKKTVTGYDVSCNNALYTTKDFKCNGTFQSEGTDAGKYLMGLKPEDFVNSNHNFKNVKFEVTDGELLITPRKVELVSGTAKKEYDGKALTAATVAYEGDGFVGEEGVVCTNFPAITNVGRVDNSFEYAPNAKTKAGNYTISVSFGVLEVTPSTNKIAVTANSSSKMYDGTPLSDDGYTVKGALAEGDVLTAVVEGSALHVGDVGNNKVTKVTITNQNGDDVTSNYANITKENGKLTVIPRDVTIVSDSAKKEYDGKALTAATVAYEGDGFVGEEGVECTGFPSITDVGRVDNTFEYVLKNGTLKKDYTIHTAFGVLEVTPSTNKIVITANSSSKMYDGTPLTDNRYTFTEGVLVEGDELTAVVEGSVTNVGDAGVNHVVSYKVMRGTTDVTKNYTFGESVDGKLEITKRDVTLTSADAEKVYNGTPLSAEQVVVSGSGFAKGEGASYSHFASITDVGSTDNTFLYTLNKNTDAVNYNIKVVEGKLEILPVDSKLVITADSASKVYDGTALTNSGFTYTEGILAEGDKLTAVVEGSATNVGDAGVNRVVSYQVMRGTTDVTKNYTFGESVDGKLEITPRDVMLTSADGEKVYDGTPLTKTEVTAEGFVEGEGASYSDFASITDVGTTENTFKYTLNESTKADNYNITVDPGKLSITANASAIVIAANSSSKMYDGTPLSDDGYTVKGALAEGDVLTAVVEGSATHVGDKGENQVKSYQVMRNGKDVTFNYTGITTLDGKLEITKRNVTLTSADGEKMYDGTPLLAETVTEEGFVEGEGASYSGFASITYVGSADNTFKYTLNENTKAEDYNITEVPGKLNITANASAIVITANSNTKMYDGMALTDDGYTVDGTLMNGDELTAVVKGHATNVTDEGINEVVSYQVMRDGVDVTANYTGITTMNGKLTITKRNVLLASADGEKIYDGTPLLAETVMAEGFVEGEGASYSDFASITDVGSTDNTFLYTLNKNTDAANYAIKVVEGKLEILPVDSKLVITADSDSKMYDGTALTNSGFTYTEGILAEGDKLTAVVEGSATNVGDAGVNRVVSYQVMRGTTDVTANYTGITTVDGKLEITKRDVLLISDSDSKRYDGTPLTAENVRISGSGFVDGEGAVYHNFASITNVGQMENTFEYTLTENTLADNYDISVANGLLSINKHTEAKLTAQGYTGIYDGAAHDGVISQQIVGGVDSDLWNYTYSVDGETFAAEMPQFKDVGDYTVYVKATNDNYEGDALITTVPVKITPVVITVTADSHTIATGDMDPELTYRVDTPVTNETPAFSGVLIRDAGDTKGVYSIKQGTLMLTDGEGFKAANYVLHYVPGELTILQRALEVTKTVDKTKACVGDKVVYTIAVTNTGDVDLENVILVDKMLNVQENIGKLAVGKSLTRTYTYVATKEDEGKQLVNTVVVTSEDGSSDEANSEPTDVKPKAPETGDSSKMQLWTLSMLVSAAGVVVLGTQRKKFMHKD